MEVKFRDGASGKVVAECADTEIGLKYAADLNGYYGGTPRLPLLPLKAEQKAQVEQLMTDIRN